MATTGGLKVTKLLQVQESKGVNISNHQDSVKIFHMGHYFVPQSSLGAANAVHSISCSAGI
jgi:hypothetical protein